MSNFFSDENGEALKPSDTYSSDTQVIIPDKTKVTCAVAGVTIDKGFKEQDGSFKAGEKVIVIKLHVVEGKYKDVLFNHKLKVMHPNPLNAKDAKSMLLSYDTNARSELIQKASDGEDIFDEKVLSLALNGTELIVQVREWDMNGRKGNHADAVFPLSDKDKEINQHIANQETDDEPPF